MKNKVVLIIVCGGTGSGKTTVAHEIKTILPSRISSQIICMDRFYKAHNCKEDDLYLKHNFDHPNAFDWELMLTNLKVLLANKPADLPIYNYKESKREKEVETVEPTDVVILEGILSLYDAKIRELADIKIFVDTPDDERFIRRLIRDKKERNRTDEEIVGQWRSTIRKMHHVFVQPLKAEADIIVPWYNMNKTAIQAIKGAIQSIYEQE